MRAAAICAVAVVLGSAGTAAAKGHYGVDVSTALSSSEVSCMKSGHAVEYVCSRVYTEDCHSDSAALPTFKATHANHLDFQGYHFPCQSKSAQQQVDDSVAFLKHNGINATTIWLDIEKANWPSDTARNTKFISDLGGRYKSHGYDVGIYTAAWSWTPITGDTHSLSSHYRLWWPAYARVPDPSFKDFSPFGGWSKPALHQFRGNQNLCGANVDASWRP